MLQCQDCEYFSRAADGSPRLNCDPFSTIKERECLLKWCLAELMIMGRSHRATLDMNRRLAPLQEKLFRHMERELDDATEADSWKLNDNEDDEDVDDSPRR